MYRLLAVATALMVLTPNPATATVIPEQVWKVVGAQGTGTAFAVAGDLLVTARHVVGDAQWVRLLGSSEGYRAAVITQDPADDIAILRTERPLPGGGLALGDPVVAQEVVAVGFPSGGELVQRPGTVTTVEELRLTATPVVEPGMSGGPLLSGSGVVVGVVVARSANAPAVAVPAPHVLDALEMATSAPWPQRRTQVLHTTQLLVVVLALLCVLIVAGGVGRRASRRDSLDHPDARTTPASRVGSSEPLHIVLGPVRTSIPPEDTSCQPSTS